MNYSQYDFEFGSVMGDDDWNKKTSAGRQTLEMEGYGLHYIDMGVGPTVVMIHGFSDSTYTFHKIAPYFNGCRLILIDQPGLGRSGVPPNGYKYGLKDQSDAVLAVLDHLGVDAFHIVGHSMGGVIALYLCLHHEDRVKKAAIIAPPAFSLTGFAFMTVPGIRFFAEQSAGKWMVDTAIKQIFYDEKNISRSFVDESSRFLQKKGYIGALFDLFNGFFDESFHKMTQNYKNIETPLCIIWGGYDRWVPVSMGIMLQKEVKNASLHILDASGHMVHQEKEERVASLINHHFGICGPGKTQTG